MSLLVITASLAYALDKPSGGESYGGSILGYVLGIISLVIVLLLTWYGVRKRLTQKFTDNRQHDIRSRRKLEVDATHKKHGKRQKTDRRKVNAKDNWRYGGTLQGWLSAHIYLGSSLIVLATLHAGFQFGWNIHTLSYVLMLLVISSGFYGTYAYLNYPRLITLNMGDETLSSVLLKIAELDELARIRALGLPDEVNHLVMKARRKTRLSGDVFQQLRGARPYCPTADAVQKLQLLGKKFIKDDQPKLMRDLYALMLRKQTLVLQARNEIMMKARMQFWLYFHTPLTIALLAALFVHIFSIFFYW